MAGLFDEVLASGGYVTADSPEYGMSWNETEQGPRNGYDQYLSQLPLNEDYWRRIGYTGPVQAGGHENPQAAPELQAWLRRQGYRMGNNGLLGQNSLVDASGKPVAGSQYSIDDTGDFIRDAALVVGAGYFGGSALAGAYGGAGAAGGAAAGAGGAAAGGMTAAEQVAFLAANGMSDAAIAAAYPGLASSAGLTGVGGAAAGAAGAAGGGLPDVPAYDGSGGWEVMNAGTAPGSNTAPLSTVGAEAGVGALPSVPAVSGTPAGGGWLSGITSFLGSDTGQLVGQIGSAAWQARSTQRANDTLRAGTDAAIAEQRRQYDTTRGDQAPYREAGVNALRELMDGIKRTPTHEEVMSDPGYQFAQQQGERGIRNQFAASGGRMSGAQMKAGVRFNQGNASSGYNAAYQRLQDILNRHASVAGLGQTSTQASAAAGQSSTNAITGLLNQQGENAAAGQLARGNIWGNVGNNLLAQYGRKTRPRSTYVDGYYEDGARDGR